MKKLSCVIAAMAIMFFAVSVSADPIMDIIQKEAAAQNEKMPQRVDEITVCTGITVGPDKRIIYHYTLEGLSSIDKKSAEKLMMAEFSKTACQMEETKLFHSLNIVLEFLYRDESGNLLFSLVLNEKECGK
jgi:hypothetical protein